MEEKNGEHQAHSSRKPLTEKLRKNPWILSTVILGIFVVLLVAGSGVTGNVVSENKAAEIILGFAEEQTGQTIELDSVGEVSGVYEVNIIFQGQTIPLYLTKDGENLIQGLTAIDSINAPAQQQQTQAQPELVKSDKPKVELFVMTHCPYGTQAEKGYIPAILELGDNVDASIKFVHYFLHTNNQEEVETPREVCIREEQSDKYLAYMKCFLGGERGTPEEAAACDAEVGIDTDDLEDCIENRAEDYYATDSALSEGYGVRGSPTLVVNGAIVQSSRSADAYLKTICGAFNNAPEICETASLDSANPSPGFGYGTTTGIANAQC